MTGDRPQGSFLDSGFVTGRLLELKVWECLLLHRPLVWPFYVIVRFISRTLVYANPVRCVLVKTCFASFLLECLLFPSEHDDDFVVSTPLALGPSLHMPIGKG
jgi:hypothetical protein